VAASIEADMSAFQRFWTRIARFAQALEGIDDVAGHYMVALEKRIEKLERDVEHVERQLRLRAGDGTQQ